MTTHILLKESYEDIRLIKTEKMELARQKEKIELLFGFLILALLELPWIYGFLFLAARKSMLVVPAVITLIFIIYIWLDIRYLKKPKDTAFLNMDTYNHFLKKKTVIMIRPFFTIILALLVAFINPVSDIIYYGAACICLVSLFWTASDIIKCHNILTTRKLPQLNKRGGEEYE